MSKAIQMSMTMVYQAQKSFVSIPPNYLLLTQWFVLTMKVVQMQTMFGQFQPNIIELDFVFI